jgi:hypothetical protein
MAAFRCRLRSVVFIAEDPWAGEDDSPRFYGHWEAAEVGSNELLEQGPGWDDADEAIAWGRERASIVLIRVGPMPQRYFSAGLEQPPDQTLPQWPES